MIHTMPVMDALEVPMVESPSPGIGKHSALGLAELLLKDRMQVDDLLRDDSRQVDLIPRFLVISLASFSAYAWAMILLLYAAPNGSIPTVLAEGWSFAVRPVVGLWLAYSLGLVAATGICLPSFYFYGLLAGVKISFLQVVTHCLKGQASTAIMLIGILPIYVAVALGMLIFAAPVEAQQMVLSLGLVLPFLAGLWGVYSLYNGFMRLADTLPSRCRDRRTCFLRRLTLAWAACYTAVTPLMIHSLWTQFTG
jgi:hypothetical protein